MNFKTVVSNLHKVLYLGASITIETLGAKLVDDVLTYDCTVTGGFFTSSLSALQQLYNEVRISGQVYGDSQRNEGPFLQISLLDSILALQPC